MAQRDPLQREEGTRCVENVAGPLPANYAHGVASGHEGVSGWLASLVCINQVGVLDMTYRFYLFLCACIPGQKRFLEAPSPNLVG